MVIRDHQGAFVSTVVAQVQGPFHGEALAAEALCLKEALSWIKELGLENVLVESDTLGVVQLLQSSIHDNSCMYWFNYRGLQVHY